MVIDDFYNNPDMIRGLALKEDDWISSEYKEETNKCFYTESTIKIFEGLVNNKIRVEREFSFGSFISYQECSTVDMYTHYDNSTWTGVLYLVPNEICQGGLTICRHKESKLTGPPSKENLNELGFNSFEDWYETYSKEKSNTDYWEDTMFLPMKYNRLVLFKGGSMFHRASAGFGNKLENSRLVQSFFFETER